MGAVEISQTLFKILPYFFAFRLIPNDENVILRTLSQFIKVMEVYDPRVEF